MIGTLLKGFDTRRRLRLSMMNCCSRDATDGPNRSSNYCSASLVHQSHDWSNTIEYYRRGSYHCCWCWQISHLSVAMTTKLTKNRLNHLCKRNSDASVGFRFVSMRSFCYALHNSGCHLLALVNWFLRQLSLKMTFCRSVPKPRYRSWYKNCPPWFPESARLEWNHFSRFGFPRWLSNLTLRSKKFPFAPLDEESQLGTKSGWEDRKVELDLFSIDQENFLLLHRLGFLAVHNFYVFS